jgi:hypothetical protein
MAGRNERMGQLFGLSSITNGLDSNEKLLPTMLAKESQLRNLQNSTTKPNKYDAVKAELANLQRKLQQLQNRQNRVHQFEPIGLYNNKKNIERIIRREQDPETKAELEKDLQEVKDRIAELQRIKSARSQEKNPNGTEKQKYIGGKRTRRSTKKSRRTRSK